VTLMNGHNGATFALLGGTDPKTKKHFGVQVAHVAHFADDGKAIDKDSFYADAGELAGQISGAKHVRPAADKPWHDNEIVIAKDDQTEKANLATINHVMDAMNDHDAESVGDLLDDKVVWSEQGMPKDWTSKAEAVKAHEGLFKAFSDLQLSSDTEWAAGDYAIVQGTMTGTNDGPAPDMGIAKPTRKAVSVKFAQLFKLKDGKVTNSWGYWNSLALAQQLGLAPAAKPAK
jgi:ketosteroid isomerase-like protein